MVVLHFLLFTVYNSSMIGPFMQKISKQIKTGSIFNIKIHQQDGPTSVSLFLFLPCKKKQPITMFFMNQQRDLLEKKVNVNPVTKIGYAM